MNWHPRPRASSDVNRIIHGDVLDVLRSLPAEPSFDCVIADPPYNHGIWRNEPVADYAAWCEEWLLYCYGWPEYLAHVAVRFDVKRQRWLQWIYDNRIVPGAGTWQRSHESILTLWNTKPVFYTDQVRERYSDAAKNLNGRVLPSENSRYGSNRGAICNNPLGRLPKDYKHIPVLTGMMTRTKNDLRTGHPTQKPVRLTKWLLCAILPNDQSGDVLIPFAGSGSECVVAQSMGHNYLGIELDEQWVRLARETLAARQPLL